MHFLGDVWFIDRVCCFGLETRTDLQQKAERKEEGVE